MFDLFQNWLQEQVLALSKGDESPGSALRLLSQTRGVALLSNVYKDNAFLEREAKRLEEWLDHV